MKVTNDPLLTAGFKGCSVRVLLDLTATFDTVDHAVLLEWLEHCVGVKGKAFSGLSIQVAYFQMLHSFHVESHKVQYLPPFSSHFIYSLLASYSESMGSLITAMLMILKYIFLSIQVKTIYTLLLTALKTLNSV